MVILLAKLLALSLAAADTACAESGQDYADGECVLAVVTNRAASKWARYDGTLENALFSPAQHAHGCRAPVTLRHLELGLRFVARKLRSRAECVGATHYIGNYDGKLTCADRGAVPVGKIAHTYCARSNRGKLLRYGTLQGDP